MCTKQANLHIFFFLHLPLPYSLKMSCVSSIRLLVEQVEARQLYCALARVPFFLACRVILFVKVKARLQNTLLRLLHKRRLGVGEKKSTSTTCDVSSLFLPLCSCLNLKHTLKKKKKEKKKSITYKRQVQCKYVHYIQHLFDLANNFSTACGCTVGLQYSLAEALQAQ